MDKDVNKQIFAKLEDMDFRVLKHNVYYRKHGSELVQMIMFNAEKNSKSILKRFRYGIFPYWNLPENEDCYSNEKMISNLITNDPGYQMARKQARSFMSTTGPVMPPDERVFFPSDEDYLEIILPETLDILESTSTYDNIWKTRMSLYLWPSETSCEYMILKNHNILQFLIDRVEQYAKIELDRKIESLKKSIYMLETHVEYTDKRIGVVSQIQDELRDIERFPEKYIKQICSQISWYQKFIEVQRSKDFDLLRNDFNKKSIKMCKTVNNALKLDFNEIIF